MDPFETLEEMKQIFENITVDNMKFVGTHASNYMSVTGTLQKDKQKMIAAVDDVLKNRDESMLRPDSMRAVVPDRSLLLTLLTQPAWAQSGVACFLNVFIIHLAASLSFERNSV